MKTNSIMPLEITVNSCRWQEGDKLYMIGIYNT